MTDNDFPLEHENDDGWSDWIHPLPGYQMKCCNCGLVHSMEFRLDDAGQINFRASRTHANAPGARKELGE